MKKIIVLLRYDVNGTRWRNKALLQWGYRRIE